MSIGTQVRNPVLVRKVDLAKEPWLKTWLESNITRSAFDPAVLSYPSTEVLAAQKNGTPSVVMPVQVVAMLESVGVNPEATSHEVTAGLIELVKAVALLAQRSGHGEICFLSTDSLTADAATQIGFEPLPGTLYRLRLPNANH